MIDFYYAPTPNGWKVAIMLGGMRPRIPHDPDAPWPGRPVLAGVSENQPERQDAGDRRPRHGGDPVSVFESGAILFYLAEKTGRFMPAGPMGRKETLEWLFWQVGNQGPMAGQLSHFVNYAPDGQDYGRKRYAGEYDRNLGVLEQRLAGRDYILGDYSIADMIAFPWAFIAKPLGASLDEFPNVAAWRGRLKERPAVRAAINLYKDEQNRGRDTAQNNDILFNQSAAHLTGGKTD